MSVQVENLEHNMAKLTIELSLNIECAIKICYFKNVT